jgi:hypothetical protein
MYPADATHWMESVSVYDLWMAAYLAGYRDRNKEQNYDPGNSMPDTLAGFELVRKPNNQK